MKVGEKTVTGLKLGTVNISRAYLGSTLVWEADGGETQYGVTSWSSPGTGVIPGNGRYGWVFTIGASNLTVTKLRHYKRGPNAATWRVIIHRNSDGAVMVQADVETAADGWTEESVSDTILSAGATYTISARVISGDAALYRNPTGIAYASAITVVDDGVFGGADDNRPTTASSNAYPPVADFEFTVG